MGFPGDHPHQIPFRNANVSYSTIRIASLNDHQSISKERYICRLEISEIPEFPTESQDQGSQDTPSISLLACARVMSCDAFNTIRGGSDLLKSVAQTTSVALLEAGGHHPSASVAATSLGAFGSGCLRESRWVVSAGRS